MACPDCYKNCETTPSDKCVIYTGDDIPLLGICNGDALFEVDQIILNKLLSALDGTGIYPKDVTLSNCPHLKNQMIGEDENLNNLLQLLIDNQCSLKEAIDELSPSPSLFNTLCLTGLPENATSDDILQATVTLLCSIKTTVDAIPATYVKNSDLETLVNQIITGNNTTTVYKNRLIPYTAFPYFGSLSNFDNTGKGIVSAGFDKVYLCNGLNGTPDLRGRTLVGAVSNVPGATLDSAVNPTNPLNVLSVNYMLNEKFGENFHSLAGDENGQHIHGVVDPGHVHRLSGGNKRENDGGGKPSAQDGSYENAGNTDLAKTGISLESSGKGNPHENRQPSLACYFIIHLP